MGEGIKVGGYNPIIIDGTEYKDVLNLSTKWQWVDDVSFEPATLRKLVLLKNKIHIIDASDENYRLEENGVVQDISLNATYTTYWFCSDGDNIYYVRSSSSSLSYPQIWKFDGEANTQIFDFLGTEFISGFPYAVSGVYYTAVDKVKKRLYLVFKTKNKTSSTGVSYSSVHGYLDLQTLTFVSIAEHPDPDKVILFMCGGNLYSLKDTVIYKYNESENSWTQILSGSISLTLIQGQEDNDEVFFFGHDYSFYKFDGTSIVKVNTMPSTLFMNAIFKDNVVHAFGGKYIGSSTSANEAVNYQHQVLKKVLCLEV